VPAVIVQTDAFPASHASVVVCQMTSDCSDAPDFRVTVDPTATNGLRVRSQVMADGSLGKILSIIQRTAVAMARWFNLLRCFSPVPQR
jgi:hypothetical protein